MAHITINQNNFAGGEINPSYYSRKDLALYLNGVKKLKNIDIQPSGSLQVREGMEVIQQFDEMPYLHKVIAKDGRHYLLFFVGDELYIHPPDDYEYHQKFSWDNTAAPADQLNFVQGEDVLFICHKDQAPKKLMINDPADSNSYHEFELQDWQPKQDDYKHYLMPYEVFADADIELTIAAERENSGSEYRYYASFSSDIGIADGKWIGQRFAYTSDINNQKKPVEIEIIGEKDASGQAECKFVRGYRNGNETITDWVEPVFSNARGWPQKACFHKGRLVFAKTNHHQNRIWMSKAGDFEDFNLGDGADDQAIDVTLSDDAGTDILHLLSGRHLQVFTVAGEWVVTNDVVTPTNIEARQRTTVGSLSDEKMCPLNINGVTAFCDNINYNLHEYVYTDIEDAYVVNSLSRQAPPLQNRPAVMDYDKGKRRLSMVMSDGRMRILWLFNEEKIIGWSHYETSGGYFRDYVNCESYNFAVVERPYGEAGKKIYTIERFSPFIKADCFHQGVPRAGEPLYSAIRVLKYLGGSTAINYYVTSSLNILTALKGKMIEIYAREIALPNDRLPSPKGVSYAARFHESQDGVLLTNADSAFSYSEPITFEKIRLPLEQLQAESHNRHGPGYMMIYLGLSIEIDIEALPPTFAAKQPQNRYRLLQANFSVCDTPSVAVDSGLGLRTIAVPPSQASEKNQNIIVSGGGWKNTDDESIWQIRQYAEPNFTLNRVEMHLSVH